MRISHSKKFVFISVPRTGSTSIRKCIDPYSEIKSTKDYPYFHHASASELKSHFERKGWPWKDYYKFAFVRNPYGRLISMYNFGKPDKKFKYFWDRGEWNKNDLINFNDWILGLNEMKNKPRFLIQSSYLVDENGKYIVDFIGKVENFDHDLKILLNKFNIKQKIPHINKTKHKAYQEYYNSYTKQIVKSLCKKDIQNFGYKFEKINYPKKIKTYITDYYLRSISSESIKESINLKYSSIYLTLKKIKKRCNR